MLKQKLLMTLLFTLLLSSCSSTVEYMTYKKNSAATNNYVNEVLAHQNHRLSKCYATFKARNQFTVDLVYDITAHIEISRRGYAEKVTFKSSHPLPPMLENCLGNVFYNTKFRKNKLDSSFLATYKFGLP